MEDEDSCPLSSLSKFPELPTKITFLKPSPNCVKCPFKVTVFMHPKDTSPRKKENFVWWPLGVA
jgi:hypothetical protein